MKTTNRVILILMILTTFGQNAHASLSGWLIQTAKGDYLGDEIATISMQKKKASGLKTQWGETIASSEITAVSQVDDPSEEMGWDEFASNVINDSDKLLEKEEGTGGGGG